MKLFSWKGEIDTILSPRDSIRYNKYFIHSGMMSMDPISGYVKSYVGGINYSILNMTTLKFKRDRLGLHLNPFYIH